MRRRIVALAALALLGASSAAYAFLPESYGIANGFALAPGQSSVPAPTLGTLTISSSSFTTGQSAGAVLATISGQAAGDTVTIASSDTSGIFAVSGTNLIAGANYAAATAGSYASALTDTLAGATNSPKTTPLSLTLTNGPTHYYMTNASGGFIQNASNGYIQIQ